MLHPTLFVFKELCIDTHATQPGTWAGRTLRGSWRL
jgi:hypothetical protein